MHSSQVTFCQCFSEMESLVQNGFWPSSPRDPTCAISVTLLDLITSLILETQSSVKSICQSLKWFNGMHNKDIAYLYKVLTNETLEEFRHFKFMIRSMQSEAPNLDDGSSCPACPKTDGEVFISLDANFGLVRKQNSGHSLEPPKHSRYFIEQNEVDEFVSSYATDEVPKEYVEQCNNFQAINTIRAKNKIANLDSKGVFGSACRHEIPILFLSMRHGERYAYPVLLLEKLLTDSAIQHHVIYDIACKFEEHIKKNKPDLSEVDFALPAFHAYGHKLSCQVSYSTRWKEGYCLTDGECMERLWSYMRKFSHLTKEMTPSHRIDLLSDALLHYTSGKISQLGHTLSMALLKGRDVASQALCIMQDMCSEFSISIDDIRKLRADVKHRLMSKQLERERKKSKPSWKELYVKNLDLYHHLSLELAVCEDQDQIVLLNNHLTQTQQTIQQIETKNAVKYRWSRDSENYRTVSQNLTDRKKKTMQAKMRNQAVEYIYMKEISKKYSAGQAIAQRVSKQLQKLSRSIRGAVNSYNNEFPSQQVATFSVCADPNSSFYCLLDAYGGIEDQHVPVNIQRKAIDALNMYERALEEQKLVQNEMLNTLNFFKYQVGLIKMEITNAILAASQRSEGILCLLRDKQMQYEEMIEACTAMFDQACEGFISNDQYISDEDDEDDEDN